MFERKSNDVKCKRHSENVTCSACLLGKLDRFMTNYCQGIKRKVDNLKLSNPLKSAIKSSLKALSRKGKLAGRKNYSTLW